MGEVLEIVKTLVSPTEKLMDMVGGAIGIAYEPRHKRKMAEATAHEINVIADAMRNAADMPVVYNQDGVAINTEDFQRLMQRAGTRFLLQETKKQYNIESIIDNAYDEMLDTTVVSDKPVDNDWINSFFNYVENISSEQMQILWGKLLAGEVKNPGSFSIRTLDVLRKMTHHEADLFHRITPYILRCSGNKEKTLTDFFIIAELVDDSFEDDIMRFPHIQLLSEAGLVSADSSVAIRFQIEPGAVETIRGIDKKIEFTNIGEESAEISRRAFLLTEAGKELYSIMSITDMEKNNTEYFEKCANILTSNEEYSFIGICTGQIEYRII